MRKADTIRFCWISIRGYRFRSFMAMVAVVFGVTAVITLTALGEGARRYVLSEFAFLGKDVLVMLPGRNETTGGLPPLTGVAARSITLSDVDILHQRVSAIRRIAPLVIGTAEVSFGARARETLILGTTDAFVPIRQLVISRGRNLNTEDIRRATDECLIGETLHTELLDKKTAVGALFRVADYRCRVVGVVAGRGDAFGVDLSDALILSVGAAQRLFNTESLFRVLVQIRPGYSTETSRLRIRATMAMQHQGEEDVTIISPDALLATFSDLLAVMTLAVAAIGGVSLLVSGILIMNITVISVTQRTREIGLLKALGADSRQIRSLFVLEAMMLSGLGAVVGTVIGQALVFLGRWVLPMVDFATPLWAWLAAPLTALLCGWLFSWLPARRASTLLPLRALQGRYS